MTTPTRLPWPAQLAALGTAFIRSRRADALMERMDQVHGRHSEQYRTAAEEATARWQELTALYHEADHE